MGYFSKEKGSFLNYNVSCILTLPHHQRKGYGKLMIDFSYLLSRKEGKTGTPEKPLSDLGLLSYRAYWTDVLLDYLLDSDEETVSIKKISEKTAIFAYDIVSTLQSLNLVKYWRGKHVVLLRPELLEKHARDRATKRRHQLGESALSLWPRRACLSPPPRCVYRCLCRWVCRPKGPALDSLCECGSR